MIKKIDNELTLQIAAINLAEDYEEIMAYEGEEVLIIEIENAEVIGESLGVISAVRGDIILVNSTEIGKCISDIWYLEISDNYVRYLVADI